MVNLVALKVPSEGVLLQENRTTAYVNTTTLGNGSLIITESCVCWINENGQGFTLSYPEISLHAISRDVTSFPHLCLYVMVDAKLNGFAKDDVNGGSGDAAEDSDEDDDESDSITEVRFVAEKADSLDVMYQALSDGNILHPDADDSFSDEEDDDENEAEGTAVDGVSTEHGDSMDQDREGQFENADDEPTTDPMS